MMGRRKTALHQAAKISGLEEQVQRKQRRGKAVDTVPPPAQAGVGWGGPWGNVRSCRHGCFVSLLCISEASCSLRAPENQAGCSRGEG